MDDPTQEGGTEDLRIDDSRLKIEQAIAAKVRESNAADFNQFNEDTGEVIPNALAPEPAAVVEPVAEPVAAPAAPVARMVPIVIDGQTIEVEESRLLETGKRTLQKETAADKRLQEATQKLREAEQYAQRLQQLSTDAARQPAPSQDTPQQSAPAISQETLDAVLENKLYTRDAQKAAAKFREDFPEIASDQNLMNLAITLENQRLSTVTALQESPGDPFEAYRKHGESIRSWLKKYQGPAADPQIEDKAEKKRTIQTVPAANAKAPSSAEKKPPTVQELIEQERNARRGRPVQGYQVLGRPRLQ